MTLNNDCFKWELKDACGRGGKGGSFGSPKESAATTNFLLGGELPGLSRHVGLINERPGIECHRLTPRDRPFVIGRRTWKTGSGSGMERQETGALLLGGDCFSWDDWKATDDKLRPAMANSECRKESASQDTAGIQTELWLLRKGVGKGKRRKTGVELEEEEQRRERRGGGKGSNKERAGLEKCDEVSEGGRR